MNRALALVDTADQPRETETAFVASAAPPLVETKLFVPRLRSKLVSRPRLTSVLREQEAKRLTLISAPAGFGKTTLLAEWIADTRRAEEVAWVSLDASENDPRLFWAYVIRALQKTPGVSGTEPSSLLRSVQPQSIESILTTLINEIVSADVDCLLVLDDYHVIEEPEIHGAMTFLLDHLPPRMHIVIASRSAPPLPLPRLRARGELTEVRADHLRFTPDEAATFLNQVMGLDLRPGDVGTLERRTEGWIAALKLAALSIKGRDDVQRFVDAFSGENRHVADYLVEEVLESESETVRRFLLATSILERLSGPLCDAVTGEIGSQSILQQLERRNLFIVALDDRREWYRYHHLFAEVLQKQASAKFPDEARAFHRRASQWYEEHGAPANAVRHALASDDSSRAADLLEHHWPEKDRSYEAANWLARVKTLPDEIIRARPVLSMGYAWGLLNSGELEAADLWIGHVERALQSDRTHLSIGDDLRFQSLATELASARIYLAQSRGEIPGTLEHAMRALERIPQEDHAARATGIALLALAHWGRGELEQAHDTFSSALDEMRVAGHDLDAVRGMFVLGDIRYAQGRLREAGDAYRRGLTVVSESPRFSNAEIDELHLGMSELHREWNDLASATSHLDAIRKRETTVVHKGNLQRWCVAMARVREARGDMDGALELLGNADEHERRDPLPRSRPIPAMKARIHIARGNVEAAIAWERSSGATVKDTPSYLREYEHLTLARLLIAQRHRLGEVVVPFLDRLCTAARTGGRMGSVIESLVLLALGQHALGNVRAALDALTEALTLAEPEGYLRVFLDEGSQMRALLRTATARGLAGAYTRHVLAAFEAPPPRVEAPLVSTGATPANQPLTTRELEILRLIAAGLRNAEIAEHLQISPATVKRHIANTYAKLGVEHRTEALARAAEMKIL